MFTPSPSGRTAGAYRRRRQQPIRPPSSCLSPLPSVPARSNSGSPAPPRAAANTSAAVGRSYSPAPSSVRQDSSGRQTYAKYQLDGQGSEDGELTLGHAEETRRFFENGTILKHDGFTAVSVLSQLPAEIQKAIDTADPYTNAASGELDILTGHGVLITGAKTYVWSFESKQSTYTTCYTFSSVGQSPSDSTRFSTFEALPLAALIPRSTGREPGFLLVSTDGRIRFWDSIAASLTGQERCQQLSVLLGNNESIVSLLRCDSATCVIGTSYSRLFRVSITSTGGSLQAQVTPFQQSRSLLGRLFGGSSTGGSSVFNMGSDGFAAITSSPPVLGQGYQDIYACGQNAVQRWRLVDGGGEKLLGEQDIAGLIAADDAITPQGSGAAASATDGIGVSMIDIACFSDGSLAVLYSFAEMANSPFSYGIATIRSSPDQAAFVLESRHVLQYRALRDPRPYSSPRLIIPNGGPAIFIAFTDNLVMTIRRSFRDEASGIGLHFEENIALKGSARNRFLGHGYETAEVAANVDSIASLSCLSAQSGALVVELSITAAQDFANKLASPAERQAALNDRLQIRLEQAVFFDSEMANPLSFALSQSQAAQGDLSLASENVSSAIVSSSSAYLQHFFDVRTQLSDRLSHLKALIEVVRSNDLLGRLAPRTVTRLRADAELLAASAELWQHHNQRATLQRNDDLSEDSPLVRAIEDVMAGLGFRYGQDTVRLFFRKYISQIAVVFEQLHSRLKALDSQSVTARGPYLAEFNRIAIAAFQGAHRYRSSAFAMENYGLSVEGILTAISFEAWTCRSSSLQFLETLFHATEAVVRERTRELGSDIELQPSKLSGADLQDITSEQYLQMELKAQTCDLARYTLSALEERVAFLSSAGPAHQKELNACLGQYRAAKPKLIYPLVSMGRPDRAFGLAERHRDFRTLTELCLDPATGDPQPQIHNYLRRYRQNFAFELYKYWLDHGKTADLLRHGASTAEWGQLLQEFLRDASGGAYPRVSWLHDVSLGQFQAASATLLTEASKETTSLQCKNVILSLGKLGYLAQLDEGALAAPVEQRKIELIDDELDLISAHHKLIEMFQTIISSASVTERRSAAGAGHRGVVELLGRRLLGVLQAEGQKAFVQLYLRLSSRLLDGAVLTSDDLIDLLTMKDYYSVNEEVQDDSGDFETALEVTVRAREAEGLQRGRLSAILASIWRRALLRDDWAGNIVQTRGASDEDIVKRLESTVWYRLTLAASSLYHAEVADETNFSDISCLLGRTDVEGVLSAITQTPSREVIDARFQYERRLQGHPWDNAEDGNEEALNVEADGAGCKTHQGQLFYDDVCHEVSRARALLERDRQEGSSGGQEESSALLWIREAYRLATEAAKAPELSVERSRADRIMDRS